MAEQEFKMTVVQTTVTTYTVWAQGEDRVGARNAAENGIVTSEEVVTETTERVVDWPSMEQVSAPAAEAEEVSPTTTYERAEAGIRQLLEQQAAMISGRHAQRKADAEAERVTEIEEGRLPDLCSPFTLSVELPIAQASDGDEARRNEIQVEGQVVYSVDYDRVYLLAAARPNNGSIRSGRIIEFGQEGETFPQFFMGDVEFHLWNLAKVAFESGCELNVRLTDQPAHEVVLEETDAFSLPEVIELEEWKRRHEGTAPAVM